MDSVKRSIVGVIGILWLAVGCSTGQVKTAQPIDLSSPGNIAVKIEAKNEGYRTEGLAEQVEKNLQAWHYPVVKASDHAVSHVLTAQIGNVEHGSTPTGFSFSPGNSDPRALEFQKADVLTITCKLGAVNQPLQSAELSMGFSDSALTKTDPDLNALADHISTVCFNLLEEVNWPVKKNSATASPVGNGWMPEIRIETEEEAAPSHAHEPSQPNPTASSPSSPEPSGNQTEPAQQPETAAKTPQAVTKEITKEGRKVYIIHNQGNPIIFKFGHERK